MIRIKGVPMKANPLHPPNALALGLQNVTQAQWRSHNAADKGAGAFFGASLMKIL
ncbi:hypothetical protein [Synechococcus sp. BA-132 BA5]|uniref:hypothetical protein n=1 Tax=Synechococcus sp. BA-132 BA5 TaxID=3110252 RepID=UPI002B1F9099|nr:hypothetical protein [Synechococcus sp. BA-132 BA5]MEA5414013.1 hypothetical protein [Synechococcus sp. BA-132 BA5]